MEAVGYRLAAAFDKPADPQHQPGPASDPTSRVSATAALRDGSTYDVGEALANAASKHGRPGVIVTGDPELVAILDSHPFVDRTAVPAGRASEAPEDRTVALDVAGLSAAANEGRAVDRFGDPLEATVGSETAAAVETVSDLTDRKDLEKLKAPALRDLADAKGVEREGNETREQLIELIATHAEASPPAPAGEDAGPGATTED